MATKFTPTHENIATKEKVRATHWQKDGDHPQVVRYPIDRREYKGLLDLGPKRQYALRFGEWIVEDEKGRAVIKTPDDFKAGYKPLEAAK